MKKIVFLVLICLIFLLIRIAKITQIPSSLYWDEASIGYNAYSIADNLHDEWGEFLPVHFRAFGEFKLPVYVYSVAVLTKLIGSNETAVRLPAVLYSLGTLVVVYYLVLKITKSQTAGLFSAFYLSVSPWFFIFSRTGYEATAGLFFFALGLYLFLKSRTRPIFLILTALTMLLSMYSYNSFRIIVPIFVAVSVVYSVRSGLALDRKFIKYIFISLVLLAIGTIPIFKLYFIDNGASRYQVVAAGKRQIVNNYLSHFSPEFLFEGDKNPRSQIPGFGELYIIDVPIIILGAFYCLKTRNKFSLILFILLFSSFIPASITRESPHALRTISAVLFVAIFWGLGVEYLFTKLKTNGAIVAVGIVVVTLILTKNYLTHFFTSYNSDNSEHWQFGYKQLFLNYKNDFSKYNKVIVSDEYAQPYIFALYYLKYDPKVFISEAKYNDQQVWGFSTVSSFANFEFRKVKVDDYKKGNLVFASTKDSLSEPADNQIKYLNGNIAFNVYKP